MGKLYKHKRSDDRRREREGEEDEELDFHFVYDLSAFR